MAQPVAAMRVDLGLNSAEFTKGLSGAQSALSSFASGIGSVLGNVAALVTVAAAAMTAGISTAINDAEKLGKMSEKLGVPVDEMSRLAYAAKTTGASIETLQSSMMKMQQSMSESVDGLATKGALAFDKLGISALDASGKMRPTGEVFNEIIAKLSQFENNANRTAVGTALFGSAYSQLIAMIDQGTEALEASKRRAEELGLVLSKETTDAAKKFKDTIGDLGSVMHGYFNSAMAASLPYLQMFTEWMAEAATKSKGFEAVADGVAWVLDKVARAGAFAVGVIQTLGAALYGLGAAAVELSTGGGLDGFFEKLGQIGVRAEEIAASVQSTLNSLDNLDNKAKPLTIQGQANKSRPDIGRMGRGDLGFGGMSEEMRKFERELERFKQSIRTPYEALQEQLMKIDQFFQAGRISAEQFGAGVELAYKKFREESIRSSDLAMTLQSSLGGIFDTILNGTFKLRDAFRRLAADLAKMMANRLIKDLIGSMFSGGGGDGIFGWIGSLFGGGKAIGGPVSASRAYLVGEQGPELMVPNTAGTIIPARDLAGAGAGGPIPIEITVSPTGEFDARVGRIADSRAVVAVRTGIAEYDRNVAPTTVRRIENDPRRIG